MFNINKDKSPGLDGFNGYFFRTCWNIVGQEITDAILEFFDLGQLLKRMNATYLALIPKCSNPESVRDYRHISYSNVLYNVISKILADRMNRVLHSLIDKTQSAFVVGRSISDNIFLAQELLRNYKSNTGKPNLAIKIDTRRLMILLDGTSY